MRRQKPTIPAETVESCRLRIIQLTKDIAAAKGDRGEQARLRKIQDAVHDRMRVLADRAKTQSIEEMWHR